MTDSLALVVTTSPTANATHTAYKVVEQAIANNVDVIGVFFYQDGVLNASKYLSVASDETQVISLWQQLQLQHNIALHLCATAAEKRGLIHPENDTALLHSEFTLSGLGELVMLTNKASKVVQL
mgnify:CR=1 FL=1